jgi:hypothetical protein
MAEKLLESIVNLSVYNKQLDGKYLEILNFLLKHPNLTAYDIHKAKPIRYREYSTARRDLEKISDLNLIERSTDEFIVKEKKRETDPKPYRLSLNGIFYIILNNFDGFYEALVKPLLKNYGSNSLFILFLYPYIDQKTLLEVKDDSIFYVIFPYLKDVCNKLLTLIKSLDSLNVSTSDDRFVLNPIFMWPCESTSPSEIPFDKEELKRFLRTTFNLDWIDRAKITHRYTDNVVDIIDPSDTQNVARITINEKDKKAVL